MHLFTSLRIFLYLLLILSNILLDENQKPKVEPKRSWILGKTVPFALDPGTGLFEGMF